MTLRKVFYKKLKEGKAVSFKFEVFELIQPYYVEWLTTCNKSYIPMRGRIKEGNWVITKISLGDN